VVKKYTCTVEGCTKLAVKERRCTMHYKAMVNEDEVTMGNTQRRKPSVSIL